MIAYHIDRSRTLFPGMKIDFMKPTINPEFLSRTLHSSYPEGISMHGNYYFARQADSFIDTGGNLMPQKIQNANAHLIDNVFEYERRINFPQLPSRFQSIFCSETISEARKWIDALQLEETARIWEINYDHGQSVKLDSGWLKGDLNNLSFLVLSHYATQYWSGVAYHEASCFESLVRLPVTVGRMI